jgi:transposase InsO family protein
MENGCVHQPVATALAPRATAPIAQLIASNKPIRLHESVLCRPTTGEGWLYLVAIKDMATRQIVGWSMADHLKADLCVATLVMALQRWRPVAQPSHTGSNGCRTPRAWGREARSHPPDTIDRWCSES